MCRDCEASTVLTDERPGAARHYQYTRMGAVRNGMVSDPQRPRELAEVVSEACCSDHLDVRFPRRLRSRPFDRYVPRPRDARSSSLRALYRR